MDRKQKKPIGLILLALILASIHATLIPLPSQAKTGTYLTLQIQPSATVNKGDTVQFWARLFDSAGNVVLYKTLKFYVAGNYVGEGYGTGSGWVSISYTVNLNPGSYEVKVVFEGDASYDASYKTQTLTVQSLTKSARIVSATPDKGSYYPGETVSVSVVIENTGNVALNVRVNVDISNPSGNNVQQGVFADPVSLNAGERKTVSKPYWTVPSDAIVGTYYITVGLYDSSTGTQYDIKYRIGSFNVQLPPKKGTYLTLEIQPSSTVNKGDTVQFWARLFDSDGNVLLGKTLKFYVAGNYVGSGSNPSTGWVSISYTANLDPGSYEVKVVFEGDANYDPSYKTQSLTISVPLPQIQEVGITHPSYSGPLQGPITVTLNGQFEVWYKISNPSSQAVDVVLGCTIRDSQGNPHSDQPRDKLVTLPASSSAWYSRLFYVPSNIPLGTYDVAYGIWKADWSQQYQEVWKTGWLNLVSSFSVTLTSSTTTGTSLNIGRITFDGTSYNLPITIQTTSNGYNGHQVIADPPSGWLVDRWESSGDVDVWYDPSSINYASVTVEGNGGINVVFKPEPTFDLSVNPTYLTVVQGGSTSTTVTLTSQNGFSGYVQLSLIWSPVRPMWVVEDPFNPNPVYLSAGGTATSTLTISVSSSATPGTYNLAVFAISGEITRQVDLQLTVIEKTYPIAFYTSPSNVGSIVFSGTTYTNGQSGSYASGSYPISANVPSGYTFAGWTTTGSISVSNPSSSSTTATVSGSGTLTVNFQSSPQPTLTCTLVSPSNGATLSTSPVELKAQITSGGSAIQGATVKFYVDGSYVGSSPSDLNGYATYSYYPSAGLHNWYTIAEKSSYNSGTSLTWSFTYNPPLSSGYITVSITNNDDDTINVDLYIDNEWKLSAIGRSPGSTYTTNSIQVQGNSNHEVKIIWQDPDTAQEYQKAQTVYVASSQTVPVTLTIDPHEPPPIQKPDLRITNIDLSPYRSDNKYAVGESITIYPTVVNEGSASANNFKVNFYVDNNLIYSWLGWSLGVGESTSSLGVTWTAIQGSHVIKVVVDPDNTVDELDESDNELSVSIIVEATVTPTRSNPTVILAPSSQSSTAGSTLTYTVSITNNDDPYFGSSTFSLTYSLPSGWSASLSKTSVTIAPGSTDSSVTLLVTSSSSASSGSYPISVTATNAGATSYQGTGSTTHYIPLINTPPTCSISFPEPEDVVSGVVTISGIASDPDPWDSVVAVYLKIDDGNWQQATGTSTWSYSWDTTKVSGGSHAIYAKSYDGTAFSDVQSRVVTVNNVVSVQAKIIGLGISYGPYKHGDVIKVWVKIKNIGSVDHTLWVGWSVRSQYNPNVVINISPKAISLSSEQESSLTLEWMIPTDADFGEYDATFAVWREYDATNNQLKGELDRLGWEFNLFKVEAQLYGYVKYTDGNGDDIPLEGIEVKVSWGLWDSKTTYTNSKGMYEFNNLPVNGWIGKNTFSVEASLADGKYLYIVEYGPKSFKKKVDGIQLPDTGGVLIPDFLFNAGHERNAARIYYYMYETVKFYTNTLGFKDITSGHFNKGELDGDIPETIIIFHPDRTAYHTGDPTFCWIVIGEYYSSLTQDPDVYRHELSHHMMFDLYESNIRNNHPNCPGGNINHQGDDNPCTCDGIVEGWAEFMPCIMTDDEFFEDENIELNWHHAVDHPDFATHWYDGRVGQEIAIAGILWDLYDGSVGERENVDLNADGDYFDENENSWLVDNIQLSKVQMWNVLSTNDIYTIRDLYMAFRNSGYVSDLQDLKNIFITHGWNPDAQGWV